MSGNGAMAIANAPCSYGAFEITVGIDPLVLPALDLLDAVTSAGYTGIDLGPLGYLGGPDELPGRLEDRGLSLAGGYFEVQFSDPARLPEELERLDLLLDTFEAAEKGGAPARPTLADAGSESRSSLPGRAQDDHALGWDAAGWRTFADSLARLAERCRRRGYEPTFHPHTATYVEAPWEIDRLLDCSDVGVCLDTGHILVGGGDPLQAVSDWHERINHVHLKDARQDVIDQIVRDGAPVRAIWERHAFCPLGTGDVPVANVLGLLRQEGYSGWLVVEQDTLPEHDAPDQPAQDQARNRDYLRAHGL
jgi:inosose dehydratase